MKKILLCLAGFICLGNSSAQTHIRFACYYGETANPNLACMRMSQYSFNSNTDATAAVNKILAPLGLAPNFILVPCDGINNCAAITLEDGFRYVVYDGHFMDVIANNAHTDWAYTSILAHELGHHLQGHTGISASLEQKRRQELEADHFSGFICYKLGATLEQAEAALFQLPDPPDESTSDHPLRWRRLQAASEGYEEARLGTSSLPSKVPTSAPSIPSSPSSGVMLNHDIITSAGFPNLDNAWSRGYELCQAIYANNQWYSFMTRDVTLGNSQSYRFVDHFPGQEIQSLWDANKRISSINFGNNYWVLVMSQLASHPEQRWQLRAYFPESEIAQNFNEGYYIVDMAYGDGSYAVIYNNKTSTAFNSQVYRRTINFPDAEIKDFWAQGYRINMLKYLNGEWVLVMTSLKGNEYIQQRWNTAENFPMDILLKNEQDGFLLKYAAFDGRSWVIVMNKNRQ